MLLDDEDYNESIKNIIRTQNVNAEYAVANTGDNFAKIFSDMVDNDYMQARATDIQDISNRVVANLQGNSDFSMDSDEKVILLADDLTPSETVQLDKNKVLSFVTRKGSSNSHTAILARTMNIPAIINVDFSNEYEGKKAIVDGYEGKIIIDPTEEELKKYTKIKEEDEAKERLLQELKGKKISQRRERKLTFMPILEVLRMLHPFYKMMQVV